MMLTHYSRRARLIPQLLQQVLPVMLLVGMIACAYAQQSVTGTVKDAAGNPVSGATVSVAGATDQQQQTDDRGRFALPNVSPAATLVVTYVGLTPVEYPLQGQTTVHITLGEDELALEEVVVVGYGTVKKRDLTGSVASVKGGELREFSTATVTHAMQGRAPGVVVTQNSGMPGANMQVRIRGTNSIIGSNEPLWIIDGFPGNQNMLNANDIESMEILKDASATAIYGSRGANGVVIVTTKRGKAGRTNVVYEGSVAFQTPRKKLDLLNAREYMELSNIQQVNDNGTPYFTDATIQQAESYDWQDRLFQTAPLHNHSIDINGGNDKTQFALNGSYYNQDGILEGTNYSRINIRANIDHKINDKLSVQFSTLLNKSDTKNSYSSGSGLRGNSLLSSFVGAPPTLTPFNDDGSYRMLELEYPFISDGLINPVAYINEVSDHWASERVLANGGIAYRPLPGLTVRAAGNFTTTNTRSDGFTSLQYPTSIGAASISIGKSLEWNTSLLVDYEKEFGTDHRLSATIGNTLDHSQSTPVSVSARGFLSDSYETYNIGSGSIIGNPSSNFSDWSLASFLGRVNYSFKDRLLLTASFRADGSSRYSANNTWGYFPSGAIAYRLSSEEFIQRLNVFDDLKLRVSYGESGSTAISPYYTLNILSSGKAVFNDALFTTFAPGTRLPADLRWETTAQFDAGIDASLFNNRLQLVADYYVKNTYDLLNSVQLARSLGYTTTVQNVGRIRNKGFELAANANIFDGDFRWNLGGNVSFNRSEVVKLHKGQDILGRTLGITIIADNLTLLREGHPFGAFYGYVEDGYDETGKIKYQDLDNNGSITTADKTFIGDPNPDFTFGLTSTLAYKGFDLNVFLQGVSGNELYSLSMAAQTMDFGFGLNTLREVLYDHWTPESPDAKYPRISRTSPTAMSDRYVYDGSYVRLKNIQLGYTLPVQGTSAYIYVSGQNVLTFSSYPWFDPEANALGGDASINQGIDWYTYPTAKSWTVGVRVNF